MGEIGEPNGARSDSSDIVKVINSRYNIVSSGGSLDCDSLTDVVVIDDITESEPTSAILNFCKKRFLLPYVNILGVMGLRPMTVDAPDWSSGLGHVQTIAVIVLLIAGYLLQYFFNFRRDRGDLSTNTLHYIEKTYYAYQEPQVKSAVFFGETTFVYAMPGVLHCLGFITAVYVFRVADNEQLQNLVERVFILCHTPNRLVILLWVYMVCGVIWLLLITSLTSLEVYTIDIHKIELFANLSTRLQAWGRTFLIITIFCHDLIQMVVLTSYAIHCYLLRCYLFSLKEKLQQNTIETLDWMREICEFQKLLHHLNKKIATPVSFFTVLNICYTLSGIIHLFKNYDYNTYPIKIFSLNVGNIILWLTIALFPFFQAASLTLVCRSTQLSGHHIRIRPFVYHNTSSEDLNSVLLFASSLRLSAKLFRMPIYSSYLFFTLLCMLVIVLTLGMCLNVSLGIV